ncbi:cell wall hydrolase [Sphingomonas sp. AOB5]|uniref:cell wall hydrolase n=1 Tax=Sphingomonas sp. AOB5 TaxID=3034017 RepID=UPI0023F85073|nr:cell wall hydrolase [Sphingomonas sp. AOB5]MDF7774457.1 cell wall hydrolase [Sphingomonas sp. AOB5]
MATTFLQPSDLARRFGVSLPLLGILLVIALAALALPALIVANTPRTVVHKPPRVVLATRVVPRNELPTVEPVKLQEVAPTDAKTINDAIPFSTEPNPAARAFRIFGTMDSQARAIDCLAAGVYYEAGDDAIGQRAVAQVILNRMRHPAFPKTVCGVVFQGQERTTGCQFTFTCDGAMFRYKPTAAAWVRAQAVARMALNGSVYAPVGHATHYHTDWVVPYWSASLEKITEVHTHLFFRWTGWWGTPPAFTRAYAGIEPNIGKMALISTAHTGAPLDPSLALTTATPESLDPLASVNPEAIKAGDVPGPQPDGNSFLMTIPKGMSPNDFASLAIRTCGDRPYCKFMAWADPAKTPRNLPLGSSQVASMSFSYLRDQNQGFAKALWNCEQYQRPSPVQCMRAQPLARPAAVPAEPAPVSPDGNATGPSGLSGVRRKEPPAVTPLPVTVEPAPGSRPQRSFTLPAPKATTAPAPRP